MENFDKKPSSKRVRLHSFVTYADEKDMLEVIASHQSSIRSYAYMVHDKDNTDVHIHLIIQTYDAWSSTQINKWFGFIKLYKNQNTFNEPVRDVAALKVYIQHKDLESITAGKEQYDFELCKDFGLFCQDFSRSSYDDTYEICVAMLAGVPTRELVRRYGKKIVYHYSQYCQICENINREDWLEASYASDKRKKSANANLQPIPLDNVNIDDVFK